MPKVVFVEASGTQHVVEIAVGESLMQAAINEMIPGIEGDCGGLCACGTCHVYVPQDWAKACGEADELERGILEFSFEVNESSRLACQIGMSLELDGMQVMLPKRQY
ncbi:MAG: 2Fe-2S iron-sulfur cluster binding domain-containing protein [Gammaproteobacteria bacterium]|nr:2Fe-2S iron-sulfur cluster binding domain-containing protein [Gammaproteobacteria bacterium]